MQMQVERQEKIDIPARRDSVSKFSFTEPFFLFRPSIAWMPATHIREGNLLYSNPI